MRHFYLRAAYRVQVIVPISLGVGGAQGEAYSRARVPSAGILTCQVGMGGLDPSLVHISYLELQVKEYTANCCLNTKGSIF